VILATARQNPKRKKRSFTWVRSSRYTGYVPTAICVALTIAGPMSWRRRIAGLAIGIVLSSGFAAIMVGLWIQSWFLLQESLLHAGQSGSWWLVSRSAIALLEINTFLGPYYLAPIFIWLLATSPHDDWKALFRETLPSNGRAQDRAL